MIQGSFRSNFLIIRISQISSKMKRNNNIISPLEFKTMLYPKKNSYNNFFWTEHSFEFQRRYINSKFCIGIFKQEHFKTVNMSKFDEIIIKYTYNCCCPDMSRKAAQHKTVSPSCIAVAHFCWILKVTR